MQFSGGKGAIDGFRRRKTGSGSLFPGVVHRPLASESPQAVGVGEGWEEVVKMHVPGVHYRRALHFNRPPHREVILKHICYFSEYRDDSSSKVWTQSNLVANPSSAT